MAPKARPPPPKSKLERSADLLKLADAEIEKAIAALQTHPDRVAVTKLLDDARVSISHADLALVRLQAKAER